MKIPFLAFLSLFTFSTYATSFQDSLAASKRNIHVGFYPSSLFSEKIASYEVGIGLNNPHKYLSLVYLTLGAQSRQLSKNTKLSFPAYDYEASGNFLTLGIDGKLPFKRLSKFSPILGVYGAYGRNLTNQYVYDNSTYLFKKSEELAAIGVKLGVQLRIKKNVKIQTGLRVPIKIWKKSDFYEDPNYFRFDRENSLFPFVKVKNAVLSNLWYFSISI